jgi:sortase (surface protein transpeptidase)
VPRSVSIHKIGVDAEVVRLGLTADGALEVPEDFGRTGWWQGGSVPGQPGPAVIVGHVDSKAGPAVFSRLDELSPGDLVEVTSAGGTVSFAVQRLEQHPKDAFPTDAVYGPTPGPSLRLITCAGSFDHDAGHYRDNLIVFASPVSRRSAHELDLHTELAVGVEGATIARHEW